MRNSRRSQSLQNNANLAGCVNFFVNVGILLLTVQIVSLSRRNLQNTMQSAQNTSKQVTLLEDINNKLGG